MNKNKTKDSEIKKSLSSLHRSSFHMYMSSLEKELKLNKSFFLHKKAHKYNNIPAPQARLSRHKGDKLYAQSINKRRKQCSNKKKRINDDGVTIQKLHCTKQPSLSIRTHMTKNVPKSKIAVINNHPNSPVGNNVKNLKL